MPYSLTRRVERRQNSRKRVAIKVYLSWQGQEPCRYWAIDLSMSGAFVKTGSLKIPESKAIRVAFVLNFDSLIKVHYLTATVVRRSDEGFGLMFQ